MIKLRLGLISALVTEASFCTGRQSLEGYMTVSTLRIRDWVLRPGWDIFITYHSSTATATAATKSQGTLRRRRKNVRVRGWGGVLWNAWLSCHTHQLTALAVTCERQISARGRYLQASWGEWRIILLWMCGHMFPMFQCTAPPYTCMGCTNKT